MVKHHCSAHSERAVDVSRVLCRGAEHFRRCDLAAASFSAEVKETTAGESAKAPGQPPDTPMAALACLAKLVLRGGVFVAA